MKLHRFFVLAATLALAPLAFADTSDLANRSGPASFVTVANAAGASDYAYLNQKFDTSSSTGTLAQGGSGETVMAGGISPAPVRETGALLPVLAVIFVLMAGPFLRKLLRA